MRPVSIEGYRELARRRLPRPIFDYLDGGAESESTLRRNRAVYARHGLVSRLAEGRQSVDLTCRLLGHQLTMPIVLAPTGGLRMLWPDGELAVARAAAGAGVLMTVSAGATTSLAEIVVASPAAKWFQICVYRDRGLQRDLIAQARDNGCTGLCVTLDGGLIGKRERDVRNGLSYSRAFAMRHLAELVTHWRWAWRMRAALRLRFPHLPEAPSRVASVEWFASLMQPCPTWADLQEIRALWSGELVIKAITDPRDATRAVAEGMDGIIVSNHGGRQFDGGIGTLESLPAVAEAVAGRIPVLLDGGVRRGTDVLKAIALGATACMVGRAHLFGLAVDGERGARSALEILRCEMRDALFFLGLARPSELERSRLTTLPEIP